MEWCWIDTTCLSLAVAAVCAIVAIAKRLIGWREIYGPDATPWHVCRDFVGASVLNGVGGAAVCVLTMEVGGLAAKVAAPASILGGFAIDLSTAEGRAWLLDLLRRLYPTQRTPPSSPPSPPPLTQDVPVPEARRKRYRREQQDSQSGPPEAPL